MQKARLFAGIFRLVILGCALGTLGLFILEKASSG
jgi:hypothetical protein